MKAIRVRSTRSLLMVQLKKLFRPRFYWIENLLKVAELGPSPRDKTAELEQLQAADSVFCSNGGSH